MSGTPPGLTAGGATGDGDGAGSVGAGMADTLDDYDFDLPDRLIAVRPVEPRSAARLLVATPGATQDAGVRDLPAWLRPGDLLVLNDTAVIPARLSGLRHRAGPAGPDSDAGGPDGTTARVEATLLQPDPAGGWRALLKPLKRVAEGETIHFGDALSAVVADRAGGTARLVFDVEGAAFDAALARVGAMPLPPYIARRRPADDRDRTDYQTIWARAPGAVAAPTASLHFDYDLLAAIAARGVATAWVTLHVGAGTFLPVKDGDLSRHRMHAERGRVGADTAAAIAATRARGGRVIPVGTTALRVIETAALASEPATAQDPAAQRSGGIAAWEGETDIFIRPGYRFRVTDGLMTNFHLPRSTLMMLVSALMGADRMRAVYAHAIAADYRFYSYGDASLLLPRG